MNEIQITILDIYRHVSDICRRHDIPFFAIGGTCIGAVRHKGFIPWDDDLDIAIPIQDFDRFWELAKSELPDYLSLYTCNSVKEYRYIFGKVQNINTTFIEKSELVYPKSYKGIFVDIMPISSIPDEEKERKVFYKKLLRYFRLNYIRRYPYKGMETIKKKIMWCLMRPACLFLKPEYFSDKWLDMLRSYPLGSTSLTGYTWDIKASRLTFPVSDFSDMLSMPFEDTFINCPVGYDDYLTIQFGDYMKLPPQNQREQHHTEIISTIESYREQNYTNN